MFEYKRIHTEVAVIGGGLTGTVAAYELARAGVRVTVVRDGRGASPHVAGFNVAGVEDGDSVAVFSRDTAQSANGQADDALVDILCQGSVKLPEYLNSLGFSFDTDERGRLKARKSLGSSFARVVGKGNSSGAEILALLDKDLRTRENVRILEQARALRLFCKDGRVCGVLIYEKQAEQILLLDAPCVLLASGGYAGIFPFTSNSKDISGDTVAMALLAGARVTDMEFVQFEPSCAVWPESIRGKGMITTLFYEGAVMTNALGERFMLSYSEDGERVNKDVLARAIARELREGRASEHGGVWFDCRGVDAQRMLSAYEPFVKRYKNVGIDLLAEPVEVANAAHTSLGGVKVNAHCQSDIVGLFAAGEALGNLHGANRIGGSAGTETLVFGVHVAQGIRESADLVASADPSKLADCFLADSSQPALSFERAEQIKREAKDLLGLYLGVEREEAGLTVAISELERLYAEVRTCSLGTSGRSLFEKISLENLLITALALAKSARLRDDSAGSHLRIDQQSSSPRIYRTEVRLVGDDVQASKFYLK